MRLQHGVPRGDLVQIFRSVLDAVENHSGFESRRGPPTRDGRSKWRDGSDRGGPQQAAKNNPDEWRNRTRRAPLSQIAPAQTPEHAAGKRRSMPKCREEPSSPDQERLLSKVSFHFCVSLKSPPFIKVRMLRHVHKKRRDGCDVKETGSRVNTADAPHSI